MAENSERQMTSQELNDYIDNLKTNFKGDLTHLAAALGALELGKTYGWKVLRIIYSPIAYRKYQKILGLEFKFVLKSETIYSKKSAGYNLVMKLDNFWDAVTRGYSMDSKIRSNTEEK
jgi:hypothetical protein